MTAEVEPEDLTVAVVIRRQLSPLVQLEVEPVGRWYHLYNAHRLRGSHLSESRDGDGVDEDCEYAQASEQEVIIEDDIEFLRSLDPADWKDQDHYAVLGLKKYRYKASDEDIKRAYRQKVLRHHPDKRRAAGEELRDDDDYFTNITRAYEVLGIPSKRQSYDSVDPFFDDDIPSVSNQSKNNFFEEFGPVFERNSRWSLRKHVPGLGKLEDSRQKVERFYDFWFDFESWREFSYLDEEEKEKGQDREERRWIEKQNKAERSRRKKEEMARLRKLVNNAYACDPRIAKYKEEDKEKKLAHKKAKQDAIRVRREEEERIRLAAEEELRKKKEEEEAEQKARLNSEKRERENIKKALKKEKKTLRGLCTQCNYFTADEEERVQVMTDVEYLCGALQLLQLEELNRRLTDAGSDISCGRKILAEQLGDLKAKIAKEVISSTSGKGSTSGSEGSKGKPWSQEDLPLLIKAVNLFPAGTNKRWEVVAQYINQHSTSGITRVAKEVLAKAKELQSSDMHMREAANKNAFAELDKKTSQPPASITNATASLRLETPQEMLGMNNQYWSTEEQKLLEQALKTYPLSTPDRWDCIAACVPNRSKKDCMRRYKELVEMVKAKKAAQAGVPSR